MKRLRTHLMAYMSIAIAVLLMFLASQPTLIFSAPSASAKVNEAWQRAQDVGVYDYHTNIVQTTWPTERLENIGLSSKQERIYLEGKANRHEDFMQLAMWSDSGKVENGQGAIELKIEDGQALGRVGQGEWEEVDETTNLFTSENDSLSYLVAAKNVTEMGQETRAGVSFTRYTFDVDGPTFAKYMREQMEEGLRSKGELPARMKLDLLDHYVEMIATGELWVNADGLPLRQIMHTQYPPERGAMEWYEAEITTDFSNWGQDVQAAAFLGLPRLLRQHDWQGTGFSIGLIAGLMGLVGLILIHREKKVVYRAFAIATVVSMVVGPLMNSHQVYAFSERQQARVAQYEQTQEQQKKLEEAEAKLKQNEFDPSVSPLVQARSEQVVEEQLNSAVNQLAPSPPLASSNSREGFTSPFPTVGRRGWGVRADSFDDRGPDSDGDGLSDAFEIRIATSPTLTDTDKDGLTDEIEVQELGTNPKHIDTDGDFISDKREVEGFKDASGRQWYLNPLAPDTNGDSQLDGQECTELIDIDKSLKLTSPSGSRCEDTDTDGTPDVFDFDDDNDGVSDEIDAAPTTVLAGGKSSDGFTSFISNTLNFKLEQFEQNKPMLVDIQLRPTNPKHLWYTQNVLDWPDNDKEGQIQRVFSDTFGASGKEANGDMRLLPMLEIEIPYQAGHYGNLPVKSGYSGGITPSTPLTDWLDKSKTDSYAMSVRHKDDKGTLLVHVPLNMVREQAGDSPVALGGRIYYQPNSSNFGATHKMRLVWVIRAKVDSCKPPANTDYNTYCNNRSNWTRAEQVVHSYDDEWYVTGLSVREEHGIDAAVVFENPSHTGGNAHYDNYLWHLADGLQSTFLAGRKGSDGKRDFKFSEIKRRFDKDSNSSVSNTARWNIPAQALQVKTYNFKEEGETTSIPMTHTKQILTTHFPSVSVGKTVNLLFAREETYRMALLGNNTPTAPAKDKGTIKANSLTVSFNSTPKEVLTGIMWAPFKHKGSGTWAPYPIEEYDPKLDKDFQQVFSSESDGLARAGRVYLSKSYYLSLLSGSHNSIVESGGTVITVGTPATDTQLAAQNPDAAHTTITNRLLASVVNSYIARISTINTTLSLDTSKPAREKDILRAIGLLNQTGNQTSGLGAHHEALRELANKVAAPNGGVTSGGSVDLGALMAVGAQANAAASGVPDWANWGRPVSKMGSVISGFYSYYSARELASRAGSIKGLFLSVSAKQRVYQLAGQSAAKSGVILGVGAAVGMFAHQWATNGWAFGSQAFNEGAALMAGGIATAVIMAAIAAIFPAGTILVALIALTDGILIALCQTGVLSDDYFCEGLAGALTKAISFLFYDYTPLADLGVEGRMRPTNFNQKLLNVSKGMSNGNTLRFTADVITNLYMNSPTALGYTYWHQFSDSNLRESTFKYQLQSSKKDIHDSLSKNQTSWTHLSEGDKRGTVKQSVSMDLPFTKAGMNVKTDLYLAEGYEMEAQECFLIYMVLYAVPVCYLKDKGDTIHLDLGQHFKYDVFPATLDKFYELRSSESNGFALAWDKGFPTLMDADGDGLRSKAKGGNDPDDSAGDSDADKLSDFWEIQNGYDPSNADGDNDGLNDYWERFYGTNPRQADTDNDGLLDGEEVFHENLRTNVWEGGWEIIYAFAAGNTPKKTWVTSDPLNPDTDGDKILDKLEKVYGFHPRLPSKLNVLSIQSQVNNPNATQPNLVAPGQTLVYTATIDNHLRDRYALGLLELDFPVAVQNSSVAPKTYHLTPNQQITMTGQVTVRADISASQQVTLTNRAGANIADLRAEADGRVLWLHLNENSGATKFTDNSLLGHNATCSGSNCPSAGQAGYVGQALKFDGSNDYVTVAHHKDFDFNTSGFTVMTWVKASSWTGDPAIISNKDWGSGNNKGFVLAAKSDRSNWKFNIGDGNGSNRIDVDGKPINDNQWHHLAVTVQRVGNKTTVTSYHDGVQVNQSSKDQSNINTSYPINIAQDGTGSYGYYFPGSIDEVEISPRALNGNEIADRFKEPVFHAKFDGNRNDSSIYSNRINNPSGGDRHPTINSSGGIVGGHVSFNGRTHFEVAAANNLNLRQGRGEFTLAAWVKPTAGGNSARWRGVLGQENSDSNAYPTLWVKDRLVRVGFGNGSGLCQTESTDNVLSEAQWNHVVAIFDTSTSPNTFRLYINGKEVPNRTSTACGSVTPPAVNAFSIGRVNPDMVFDFKNVSVNADSDEIDFKLYIDGDFGHDKSGHFYAHKYLYPNNSYDFITDKTFDDNKSHYIMLCANKSSFSNTCGGDDIQLTHNRWYDNNDIGSHRIDFNKSSKSGSLNLDLKNYYYQGGVDEARIYGYAMTVNEVEDLYNGTLRVLELRFDEAPRRTKFQDSSGNNLTATCSGSSCPDSGIPGRSNQALRFDGSNDYVRLSNNPALEFSDGTLSVWVKPTWTAGSNGYNPAILAMRDTSGTRYSLHIKDDYKKLQLYNGSSVGDVNTSFTPGQWYHIAIVKSGSSWTGYVNGQALGTVSQDFGSRTGLPFHIGSATGSIEFFKGFIDQVTVIRKALSAAEVQELMKEVPLLNLHLDEKLGSTTFMDDSPNANNATCTGSACPKAGSKGWMREGLVFDGIDDVITVPDSNALDLNRFSVGLWVKPIHLKDYLQPLIIKAPDNSPGLNYVLYLNSNKKVMFGINNSTCTVAGSIMQFSNKSWIENQWNHIMMTYNGQKVVLYINGTPDKEVPFTGNLCHNNEPLKIGSYAIFRPFVGQMDEIVVYGQPLSRRAVKALYDYQVAWFDSTASHNITVDADKPTVTLGLDATHIAKKDKVMAIQASDKTSRVEKVEYQIGSGSWQNATRDRAVWSFTYLTPTVEGPQTINVRATDSVGNIQTSSKSFTVDATAPTVTLDSSYTSGIVRTSKTVKLHGTVNDTSSGVRDLYVELLDHTGNSASAPQLATITSSTWHVTHTLSFPPTGKYTVRMVASDNVGNTSTQNSSTVQFDSDAPQADITSTGVHTATISGTGASLPTIAGTISEVPTPNKPLLHYHFEEASGATTFQDGSGNFLHGTCSGSACPTAGSSGKYGKSATFDGTNDHIRVAAGTRLNNSIGQLSNNFTVMAWVKPNRITGLQRIASSSLFNSSGNGFGFGLQGAGLRFTTYGHKDFDTTTIALTTGRWYHLTAVMDASSDVSFYVDGVFKEKIPHVSGAGINTDDEFVIGSFGGYDGAPGPFELFQGEIDEVAIYGSALNSEQIYAIANPTSSGVAQAQINFRHAKDRDLDDGLLLNMPFEEPSGSTLFDDISSNRLKASCTTCPTSGTSGQFGKGLQFDGSDDYLTISNPEQLASDKDLTWAAWLKTSADGSLIARTPESGNWTQGGKTLFIRSGSLAFDVGWVGVLQSSTTINNNQWHHVALTVDFEHAGQNDKVILYVDGSQVATKQDWNVNTYNEANLALKIGHTADNFPTPSFFNGLMDEVRIYKRALSADEIAALHKQTWAVVTTSVVGGAFSTWSYQLPAGIEGPHQIHLRTVDAKGNTKVIPNVWTGEVDTQAPRLTFTRTDVGGGAAQIKCIAEDYNLRESGWVCPGSTVTQTQHINQSASWYTALFTQTKLARLETALKTVPGAGNTMTACDLLNNCASANAVVRRIDSSTTGVSVILTPTVSNVFTSIVPIEISGYVASPADVQSLNVTINESTIYSPTWPAGTSEANWSTIWTPPGEGAYSLEAILTDGAGKTISDPAESMIYVDSTPPEITLTTDKITSENFDEQGNIHVSGLLTEMVAVERLDVKLDDGVWQNVPFSEGNAWQATLYSGSNQPPTGQNITLSARVSDMAGHTAYASQNLFADAAPPTPVTPTLSYNRPSPPTPLPIIGEGSNRPSPPTPLRPPSIPPNTGGEVAEGSDSSPLELGGIEGGQATQVITAATTIDDVANPTLTVKWTESSDNSGLSSYLVEWVDMDKQEILASEEVTDTRQASFTATEGQKLSVRVTSRDTHGNGTTDSIEPIYIDHGNTPVYLSWNEWAEPYRGWTENACNLLGIDYRIDDNRSTLASLQETQHFYSSWDANGLRLAWTGADWENEGDLFIYFDTKTGGSVRAYNPYTVTLDNTIVLLPLRLTLEEEEEEEDESVSQMGADYLIWVEEDGNNKATLMTWNEEQEQWVAVEEEWLYAFDADIKTTDIYLPFELLGIENPEESSLAMVALATEEDALRIWSTMPQGNSVNSDSVTDFLPEGIQTFMFNKRYEWPALASGLCPAKPFAGDQVELFITVEPEGITYQTMEDNLIEVQDELFSAMTEWESVEHELCENNPEDSKCERDADEEESHLAFDAAEELWQRMDVQHPALGDQEPITITLRLVNRSPFPAEELQVKLDAWGFVVLAEGESETGEDGEEFSTQQLVLNTLDSGAEHTFTVRAITDFSRTSDGEWVIFEGYLTNENSEQLEQQIDWLYVNYELDQEGPGDLNILNQEKFLAAGENTLSGIVIDRSGVPNLMLEVQNESGRQEAKTMACHDSEANDNQWSCPVDIGQANEGETVKIRVKATDEHGHESEWSDSYDFTVDNTPPSITLDNDTESTISDGLIGPEEFIVSGVLTDNRLVSYVDVCQTIDGQEACQSANVTTTPISETTYIYKEQPETPITIDSAAACKSGNEIVRTFTVEEDFTVANVEVGLNIAHPVRYDLNAYLTSPAGTKVTLVSESDGENLDVLLRNGATLPIEEDEDSEHDIEAPFYDNPRYPFGNLGRFDGERATGEWQLSICDNYPEEDDGTYNHSRLILTANRQQQNSQATWEYQLPMQEYEEGSQQTVAIVGVDSVGNRSEPFNLTFTVDNTPPVINANVPSSLSVLSSELSLSGEATDESGIRRIQLNIQDPNGQTVGEQVTTDSSLTTWVYTDTKHFKQEGVYQLWIEAEDQAGNRTEVGPFDLTVTAPEEIYLPLISTYDPS